jgi:ActR/RegA family two-component response regulator
MKTLLIVDDNLGTQELCRRIGERLGYDVTVAESRDSALSALARRRFSVALIDKNLAEANPKNRDGFFLIEQIANRPEGTETFLITTKGRFEDAVEGSKLGVTRYIRKYADTAKTEVAVEKVLTEALHSDVQRGKLRGPWAFCGNTDRRMWQDIASTMLGSVGSGPLLRVLDMIAERCEPLLERPQDDGLQEVAPSTIAGLYWSRGLGHAVVIILSKDAIQSPLPRLASWPENLVIDETPMWQRVKEHPHAAIHRADGVSPYDFTVLRDCWES